MRPYWGAQLVHCEGPEQVRQGEVHLEQICISWDWEVLPVR